jgi:hypothetical protein
MKSNVCFTCEFPEISTTAGCCCLRSLDEKYRESKFLFISSSTAKETSSCTLSDVKHPSSIATSNVPKYKADRRPSSLVNVQNYSTQCPGEPAVRRRRVNTF